jgi:hypothetical protein
VRLHGILRSMLAPTPVAPLDTACAS